jgi:hypothetical protein
MEDDHKIEKSRELRYTRDISGQASQRKLSEYRLIELPSWLAKHIRLPVNDETKLQIPQNSSLLTALIAICQISYAAYELLRVTGDHFERFGYSAFSLTVVPYLVMSFVNLVGNLATPVYPSIHMISTSTLREAQLRKNVFTGAIGSIEDSHIHNRRANSLEPAEVAIIPCSNHSIVWLCVVTAGITIGVWNFYYRSCSNFGIWKLHQCIRLCVERHRSNNVDNMLLYSMHVV